MPQAPAQNVSRQTREWRTTWPGSRGEEDVNLGSASCGVATTTISTPGLLKFFNDYVVVVGSGGVDGSFVVVVVSDSAAPLSAAHNDTDSVLVSLKFPNKTSVCRREDSGVLG